MIPITVCLQDDSAIGFIDLKINLLHHSAILSYLFDYDYWNRGYCTESCIKLLDVCFNEFEIKSISADIVEGNVRSQRVLEKIGFIYQYSFMKNSVKYLCFQIDFHSN